MCNDVPHCRSPYPRTTIFNSTVPLLYLTIGTSASSKYVRPAFPFPPRSILLSSPSHPSHPVSLSNAFKLCYTLPECPSVSSSFPSLPTK